ALPGEDRVEREEEKDQDRPEKERLVRLSHRVSPSVLPIIVPERAAGCRLVVNLPSTGFISGRSRIVAGCAMSPRDGSPSRRPSPQKRRPRASSSRPSEARSTFGTRASIHWSETFRVRPPAGRKRSPGRWVRSVHGNGARARSTIKPSPLPAITSISREDQG